MEIRDGEECRMMGLEGRSPQGGPHRIDGGGRSIFEKISNRKCILVLIPSAKALHPQNRHPYPQQVVSRRSLLLFASMTPPAARPL